jgi:hypothetical protein
MKRYLLLILFFSILQLALESILMTDDFLYDSLVNQLSYERISEIIDQGKKWKWLSYALIPILVSVRIFFVVFCFSIGGLFFNIENGFKKFFSIVTNAEYLFIVPGVVKLLWFSFFQTNYTLQDLQYFSPLSVFNFFNPTEIDPWLVYPLQLLNAFELMYWFVLAYQLKEALNENLSGSIGFVARTYGVGLFIWVILVMFLIVSIS